MYRYETALSHLKKLIFYTHIFQHFYLHTLHKLYNLATEYNRPHPQTEYPLQTSKICFEIVPSGYLYITKFNDVICSQTTVASMFIMFPRCPHNIIPIFFNIQRLRYLDVYKNPNVFVLQKKKVTTKI